MSESEPYPAGFEPLTPEVENQKIQCRGCDTVATAQDMAVVQDQIDSREDESGDDVVLATQREYYCSQDCMMESLLSGGALGGE